MAKAEAQIPETVVTDPMQDFVTVTLPRASGNEEREQFVGLNGKGYIIKRGVPVRVPRPVADILAESDRQKERQAAYEDRMTELAQRQF